MVVESSLANLRHFEGKWKHGATRTIRVPIALADEILEYARRVDSGDKSLDTAELDTLKQRVRELERELAELRSQLSQTARQDTQFWEMPDAADLLNQLKVKRKKSKADLQDVEAILELLPEIEQRSPLPDLYAARDAIMDKWRLVKRNEKRERFWSFANELIEEAAKLDPNSSLLARLQFDLKQEQEYSRGIAKGMSEEFKKRIDLEKKVGLRW